MRSFRSRCPSPIVCCVAGSTCYALIAVANGQCPDLGAGVRVFLSVMAVVAALRLSWFAIRPDLFTLSARQLREIIVEHRGFLLLGAIAVVWVAVQSVAAALHDVL